MATATAQPPMPTDVGGIVLPPNCKPSKACSSDRTRPSLQHAYLYERGGAMWLLATDSYIAVGIKVDGQAREGWVPIGALRLMERGQTGEQVGPAAWKVQTNEGSVTFDITADVVGAKWPIASIADFLWGDRETGTIEAVGMNTKLMQRIGEAVGDSGCRFEFIHPLRPIRVTPLRGEDRVGVQMPIRLNV